MVAPLALVSSAEAAQRGLGRPDVQEQRVSKVRAVDAAAGRKARKQVAADLKANTRQAGRAATERRDAVWPKPGTAELPVAGGGTAEAVVGGLPLALSRRDARSTGAAAVGRSTVTVLDQKAADRLGITGVVLTADVLAGGPADVTMEYGGFASAVGGGWAGRLELVQLPACALTTPRKPACRQQTPLGSDNDTRRQEVSATLPSKPASAPGGARATSAAGTAVLALTAAGAGAGESPKGSGDYSATELAESSSWSAGSSSGAFTWNYDLKLPPAAAGPTPTMSLSYDSGSVDGRTATTNNQGSPVGEGFGITESYVERSYGSCDDDGHEDVFDLCWKYDNARLVLNGKSSTLVKDKTSGQWRLQGDDASSVTRSTGADNGDDNGEHWTVVTGDGTKYVFGLDKLDGAGSQRTNSVWTTPVFGDDSGEPGYTGGDSFAKRSLTQAWRWNLDYVEDTRENAATYWYTAEANHYRKNKADKADTSYIRGGYLNEIRYGLRKGALFTDAADAKVTFGHAERCTAADCTTLKKETAHHWPDVPFESLCSKDDADCEALAPAFFTRKRLTSVNTFSWSAATSEHTPVDSWALTQKYLDGGDIGDTSDHVLTLTSLKRTAKAGTAVEFDPVGFTYHMRPNRVDGTDDILPLTRPRVSTVTSETGAVTTVTMSAPECVRSEVLGKPEDTNTRNCFPQFWNINGSSVASVDWFHKYRVVAVVTSDPAGQNDTVEQEYLYSGAAWHYSDSPFTPKDERTWSDWRGYRQVTVLKGAKDTTRSKVVSLYLQGMDGDANKDGTTKSVSTPALPVTGLNLATTTDSGAFGGQLRQRITYAGSTPIGVVVNQPWQKETARQDVPGAGDHVARYVRTQKTTTYAYLTAPKSWRARTVSTDHDEYGMPYQVQDNGDDAKSGDEICTRTWFARSDDSGITSLVSRTRTVGRTCATTDASLDLPADSSRRGDVLTDSAIAYDGAAWSATQKPSKGLPTWSGRAASYTAADAPVWQKTGTTSYDTLGRALTVTDADDKSTVTGYTPTTAGPLTGTVVTNAKGFKTSTFFDARRGVPLRTYDANSRKTELTYDAIGRLTDVWLPNRNRAAGESPSQKFRYALSNSKPSAVSTAVLKKDGVSYNTTYTIYDALLRPLQTQSPTPQGGRLLTDTRYDSRSLAYETHADIFDSTAAPNGTYTRAEYGESPTQTEIVFDGAERETSRSVLFFGVKRWTTATEHTGDSTGTSALAGGTANRVIVDARGQKTETRTYAGQQPTDPAYGGGLGVPYTSAATEYTLDGKTSVFTGPDKARWSYEYDLFGRQTAAVDPDKGRATTGYNELDQAIRVTDARQRSVLTKYDEIGRITGTWDGAETDAKRLTEHLYDGVIKGKPSSSIRYVGGKAGHAYTREVLTYDTLDRPLSSRIKLPADDPLVKAGAPATIDSTSAYNNDGTRQNTKEPALGGLPSEVIEYGYTALGQVKSVVGSTGYLLDTDYSALGQPQQLILGVANTEAHKKAYVTHTYEEGTGRITRSHVTDQTHPYMLQDLNYSYDQAGNVTAIADPTTLGGTGKADAQCFAYDGFRRLTEAWTPSSQKCSDPRDATKLSGPAPYWTGYTYDTAGQRKTETQHKPGGDTTDTYCYRGGDKQPHTLAGVSAKGNCTQPERSYTYDGAGNTDSRPGAAGKQVLEWGAEGKLAKLTEGTRTTDYLYDADGNLLIRGEKNGERVLYAGATELHLKSDGTFWAQRFYGSTELSVAVRTNESGANKLFYLAGDQHGTSSLAIASDTQAVTKRYLTAFGVERAGAVGSWVDDRSFLGKTRDRSTGLTHLDAREYDAELGRFISVDSLLETEKHQSLAGYGYAENNPVTLSDPTGLGSFSCTMGVDCPTGAEEVEETVSPPLWGASSTGTSGTSWSGPLGYTGIPTLPLVQQPPLLMGPDPMPLLFTGPVSPEMQKLQKMFMEAQAMCSLPSGSLVNNEHGGDGKVNSDGPWSLAFRWAWGADFHWKSSKQAVTLSDAKYDGDDEITQNLIDSTSMKDARVYVANTFRDTGARSGETKYSTTKNAEGQDRNLAQLVGVYASDVGGLLIGKDDRKAQGVLGSYDLGYTITESKGSTLTVKYTATTDINNESFLPMHAKWQEAANNGPKHTGGFFAGYRVEIRWQETIYK